MPPVLKEFFAVSVPASRKPGSFHGAEASTLAVYTAFCAVLCFFHAAWADEAQAWLIARDLPLLQIFTYRLHYEGTPGLWHFLLWILCRLHLPFAAMHGLSLLAGAAAVAVLLCYAPFPRPLRLLLPFAFALVIPTAVVARSYSLVPLLAFWLCASLRKANFPPLAMALLIGLLANTSLKAFFLAVGLLLYSLFDSARLAQPDALPRRIAAGLVLVLLLFAVYTAIPAPDLSGNNATSLTGNRKTSALLSRLTGIPAPAATPKKVAGHDPVTAMPASLHAYQRWLWQAEHAKNSHGHGVPWLSSTLNFLSLAFFPVSSSNLLALLFYAALLAWLVQKRAWAAALPLVITLIGAKIIPFSEHHTSVLWTALIATLWLAWDRPPARPSLANRVLLPVLLGLVLVEQAAWTAFAAACELHSPYDGGRDAAHWIDSQPASPWIAGFNYHIVSIEPYVKTNPFRNRPTAYWSWSSTADTDAHLAETVAQHPGLIVVGEGYDGNVSWRNQIVPEKPAWGRNDPAPTDGYLLQLGYEPVQRFCGRHPDHFGFSEQTCEVIYQPHSDLH